MSDFDKIFRDKLNEEDNFPRMEQNWQKLSAQMAAANAPNAKSVPFPHPQLTAWKWAVAATGLLLVASNIWWWLHQNGTTPLVSAPVVEQNSSDATTILKNDTIYKIVYRDAEPNKGENKDNLPKSNKALDKIAGNATPSVSEPFSTKKQAEQLAPKQNLADKTPVFNTPIEKNTPIVEANKLGKKEDIPLNSTSIPVENKAAKNEKTPIVSSEKTDVKKDFSIEKKEIVSATVLAENDKKEVSKTPTSSEKKQDINAPVLVENTKNELLKTGETGSETPRNAQNIEPKRNPESIGTEGGVKNENGNSIAENTKNEAVEKPNTATTKQEKEATIAATETPKKAKIEDKIEGNNDKKDENTSKTLAESTTENKLDVSSPAPPIVKPLKWKPIFSLGVNALVALPAERDLSALKAVGATLGVKINDHFRADIAGFSGKMDYELKIHKPRWNIPKDPRNKPVGGPPRDSELREIKGRQVRQQVSLSLTYLFKPKGWLTPKMEVTYATQRIANQSARFEFRDPRTGSAITLTELSTPKTFKNLWNLGFGVEKTLGHFTGDITASFQKDFSDESVDMMVLRGGMRYSF
jgi:hypothetical protein